MEASLLPFYLVNYFTMQYFSHSYTSTFQPIFCLGKLFLILFRQDFSLYTIVNNRVVTLLFDVGTQMPQQSEKLTKTLNLYFLKDQRGTAFLAKADFQLSHSSLLYSNNYKVNWVWERFQLSKSSCSCCPGEQTIYTNLSPF